MNTLTQQTSKNSRRVITIQIGTVLLATVVAYFVTGLIDSLSVLWGGITIVISTLLLARSVNRSTEVALTNAKKGMAILYVWAVIRFLLVLVMLAVGAALIKLQPLAMLIGLVLAQAGYVMGMRVKAPNKK